jgi:hypothetical protein
MRIHKTATERFEEKYIIDPVTNCWLWQNSKDSAGYGTFRYNGKIWKAHRVSFELFKTLIPSPKNIDICHKCDVRNCVNPDHLFLGTDIDNVADKIRKGRFRNGVMHGESNPMCKLSDKIVAEIRAKYVPVVYSQNKLAREYNISQSSISFILNNKRRTTLTKDDP